MYYKFFEYKNIQFTWSPEDSKINKIKEVALFFFFGLLFYIHFGQRILDHLLKAFFAHLE